MFDPITLCDDLKSQFVQQKLEIKRLSDLCNNLKSGHYKDEELSRLKEKIYHLEHERKFVITDLEQASISRFLETHCCSKFPTIKSYRFDIIPGIGYNGYAICECGKEHCFYKE